MYIAHSNIDGHDERSAWHAERSCDASITRVPAMDARQQILNSEYWTSSHRSRVAAADIIVIIVLYRRSIMKSGIARLCTITVNVC